MRRAREKVHGHRVGRAGFAIYGRGFPLRARASKSMRGVRSYSALIFAALSSHTEADRFYKCASRLSICEGKAAWVKAASCLTSLLGRPILSGRIELSSALIVAIRAMQTTTPRKSRRTQRIACTQGGTIYHIFRFSLQFYLYAALNERKKNKTKTNDTK